MAFTKQRTWHGDTLVDAPDLNEQIRDNFAYLETAMPPVGALILFNGGALPDGYEDASYMHDRFWRGARGTYAIGDDGGADTATLGAHTAHTVGNPNTHGAHGVATLIPDHGTYETNVGSGGGADPFANFGLSSHGSPTISAHAAHSGQALSAHDGHSISILPPYATRAFGEVPAPAASWTTPRTWVTGETPDISMLNQELRDNPNHLIARALDNAALCLINAGVAPAGWHLLDATENYYTLADYFALGVPVEGPYVVGGAAAGAFPAHANHTPTQAGAHADHTISLPDHTGTAVQTNPGNRYPGRVSSLNHSAWIQPHNGHSGFGVDAHSAHSSMALLPPYLALTHIQLINTLTEMPAPRTWVTGEIISASLFNLYLRDIVAALKAREVPIDGIIGWIGANNGWPANYGACDGTGGRVDTRDKYIVGASGSKATGSTGGTSTVTAAAHSAHAVTEAANHGAHNYGAFDHSSIWSNNFQRLGWNNVPNYHSGALTQDHPHTGSTVDGHSAHAAITLEPPYYAVAFIQRTS